jgi:hypothetical protein
MCKGALLADKAIEPERDVVYLIGLLLLPFSSIGVLHAANRLPQDATVKVQHNTRLVLSRIPVALQEHYAIGECECVSFDARNDALHDHFVFKSGLRLRIATVANHDILAQIYLLDEDDQPAPASLRTAAAERELVAA